MADGGFLNPREALKAAKLREGMSVADFGAGGGFFAREAARLVGEYGAVWLVDPNGDLLTRIRTLAEAEGLHTIGLSRGNIEERGGSNLPDEVADVCIVANVLFSATNREGVVEEVHRVLKKGGRALVIDWKDSFGGLGPAKGDIVTEAAARTLFGRGGFEAPEYASAGAYHWGLTIRKK